MTIRKVIDYWKVHRRELFPWALLAVSIFVYYGYKKSFLLAYLNLRGYITFGITAFISYLICSYLLRFQELMLAKSIKNMKKGVVSAFMTLTDNSFVRTSFALVIFVGTYYVLLTSSDFLLITFSDQPFHVLFPCSESVVMTEEMKREAMKFHGKFFFSEFDCDGSNSTTRDW